MKSLLNDVDALDNLIARLLKDESRMRSGQWIEAHRDVFAVIGELKKSKRDLIATAESKLGEKYEE